MNELEIIGYIRGRVPDGERLLTDDVAFERGGLAYKVDMLVRSTDVPPGMSYFQVGRKAFVSAVSDFAAKGVRPSLALISLGVPRDMNDGDIKGMIDGLTSAAAKYGAKIVGGDVNEAKDLVIDVVLVGRYKKAVRRGGMRCGDLVFATGNFGLTSVGLDHLLRGARVEEPLLSLALKQVYEPEPPLSFGIRAVEAGYFTASMDSSDGLAITLNEMADQSGKGVELSSLPVDNSILRNMEEQGRDVVKDVFFGGEEYQVVFTAPEEAREGLLELAREEGVLVHEIGRVSCAQPGVYLRYKGSTIKIPKAGWVHLS